MATIVDAGKLAENLRNFFKLPTKVMHYAMIDEGRFKTFGDELYVRVAITAHMMINVHNPLNTSIISPTANLLCPLWEVIKDHDIAMRYVIKELNSVLQNIPLAITLPKDDDVLLENIDCDMITDAKQLVDLWIPLVAVHKPTKWDSLTDFISLRALYPLPSLNELWEKSKVEGIIQFRQWT